MKQVALAVGVVLIMASCSSVDEGMVQPSSSQIIVSASLGESDSRVTLSQADKGWGVVWSEGDALGGYSSDAAQTLFTQFTMSEFSSELSQFVGTPEGESLRFVYPYNSQSEISGNKYSIDLSSQALDMTLPFNHLGDNTHMINSECVISEQSIDNLTMQHIGAAIELNIAFENLPFTNTAGTYNYLYKLCSMQIGYDTTWENGTLEGIAIASACSIDLTEGVESDQFYSNLTDGVYKVTASNSGYVAEYDSLDNTTIYTFRFNILPFTIPANESIDLRWALYRQTVETSSVAEIFNYTTITNDSNEDITFERGTVNTINKKINAASFWQKFTISVGFD